MSKSRGGNKKVKCFTCNKSGHLSIDCPSLQAVGCGTTTSSLKLQEKPRNSKNHQRGQKKSESHESVEHVALLPLIDSDFVDTFCDISSMFQRCSTCRSISDCVTKGYFGSDFPLDKFHGLIGLVNLEGGAAYAGPQASKSYKPSSNSYKRRMSFDEYNSLCEDRLLHGVFLQCSLDQCQKTVKNTLQNMSLNDPQDDVDVNSTSYSAGFDEYEGYEEDANLELLQQVLQAHQVKDINKFLGFYIRDALSFVEFGHSQDRDTQPECTDLYIQQHKAEYTHQFSYAAALLQSIQTLGDLYFNPHPGHLVSSTLPIRRNLVLSLSISTSSNPEPAASRGPRFHTGEPKSHPSMNAIKSLTITCDVDVDLITLLNTFWFIDYTEIPASTSDKHVVDTSKRKVPNRLRPPVRSTHRRVLLAFSGTHAGKSGLILALMKQWWWKYCYFIIDGRVTYTKHTALHERVFDIPLTQIVLSTGAPSVQYIPQVVPIALTGEPTAATPSEHPTAQSSNPSLNMEMDSLTRTYTASGGGKGVVHTKTKTSKDKDKGIRRKGGCREGLGLGLDSPFDDVHSTCDIDNSLIIHSASTSTTTTTTTSGVDTVISERPVKSPDNSTGSTSSPIDNSTGEVRRLGRTIRSRSGSSVDVRKQRSNSINSIGDSSDMLSAVHSVSTQQNREVHKINKQASSTSTSSVPSTVTPFDCHPGKILFIAARIAQIKRLSLDEVIQQCTTNARQLFTLQEPVEEST